MTRGEFLNRTPLMDADARAALILNRDETVSDAGFRVLDRHHDDHTFRGRQWSYVVGNEAVIVYQHDKLFTKFPLGSVRSVRLL